MSKQGIQALYTLIAGTMFVVLGWFYGVGLVYLWTVILSWAWYRVS